MDEHTGTKKGIKRAESLELPSRKKRASGNSSKKVLKQDDQQTLRAPTTLPSEKLGAFAKLCYSVWARQPEFMHKKLDDPQTLDSGNTGVRHAFPSLISFFGGNLQNILNSSCHYWCVIKWHTNIKLVFQYNFPRVIICNWREIRVSPTLRWWSYHTIIYDSHDNHTHSIIRSKCVFLTKNADLSGIVYRVIKMEKASSKMSNVCKEKWIFRVCWKIILNGFPTFLHVLWSEALIALFLWVTNYPLFQTIFFRCLYNTQPWKIVCPPLEQKTVLFTGLKDRNMSPSRA